MMYLNNTFLLLFTLFSVLVFFYIFTQSSGYFKFLDSTFFIPFFHEVKDAFYLATTHLQISTVLQIKKKEQMHQSRTRKPLKPCSRWNKTGNVYPRPKQWCHPWGFRVSYIIKSFTQINECQYMQKVIPTRTLNQSLSTETKRLKVTEADIGLNTYQP